jgi:hypothetical protein
LAKSLAVNEAKCYILIMTTNFKDLEKEIRALSSREKAALARTLIEDLDASSDQDAEQLWIDEAQRRYKAYQSGELEAVSGEEAMQRARQRLK